MRNVPAFPVSRADVIDSGYPGMSLRDYFAAVALSGYISNPALSKIKPIKTMKYVAVFCYRFAEVMLTEREKYL